MLQPGTRQYGRGRRLREVDGGRAQTQQRLVDDEGVEVGGGARVAAVGGARIDHVQTHLAA